MPSRPCRPPLRLACPSIRIARCAALPALRNGVDAISAAVPASALAGSPRPALWVHAHVARCLLTLRAAPWEVGGWLLGYWTGDERTVVVSHATPPGPRGTPFGVRI